MPPYMQLNELVLFLCQVGIKQLYNQCCVRTIAVCLVSIKHMPNAYVKTIRPSVLKTFVYRRP